MLTLFCVDTRDNRISCTKRGLLERMTHEFDHQKDNECLEQWSNRKERTDLQRSAGNLSA